MTASAPEAGLRRTLYNVDAGGGARLLTLDGPALPALGRFARLRAWEGPPYGGGPLLDRPFSIFETAAGRTGFLIRPVGQGSRLLCSLRPGDPVRVLGPLGRGLDEVRPDLLAGPWHLAAGGTGLGAMGSVARAMAGRATLHYGERSSRLLMDAAPLFPETPVVTVSEDGPAPQKVTGPLESSLRSELRPVFACGPWPMLSAVARLARRHGVPCLVSVEARMACGLGACLSCVVPLLGGGSIRACREGPVVDASALDWEAPW